MRIDEVSAYTTAKDHLLSQPNNSGESTPDNIYVREERIGFIRAFPLSVKEITTLLPVCRQNALQRFIIGL